MKFQYDDGKKGKPSTIKGDWMVVCEKGSPSAVADFSDEQSAKDDAADRNERAVKLGVTARYSVHPRSEGTAVKNK